MHVVNVTHYLRTVQYLALLFADLAESAAPDFAELAVADFAESAVVDFADLVVVDFVELAVAWGVGPYPATS